MLTPTFFDIANGTLLFGGAFTPIPVGVIGPSGSLVVPTTLPELGPGVDVTTFLVQLLALDLTVPAAYTGTAQVLTLLDAAQ